MKTKYFYATISISAMWLAVLFSSIFGPPLESAGGDSVPVIALAVSFFALIGTIIVGIFGFRGEPPKD